LDDHEGPAIQRRGLEHPAGNLGPGAGQPHRPVQNLDQEARVAFFSRRFERALLLEDAAQGEGA
jgi:hypothetical protein